MLLNASRRSWILSTLLTFLSSVNIRRNHFFSVHFRSKSSVKILWAVVLGISTKSAISLTVRAESSSIMSFTCSAAIFRSSLFLLFELVALSNVCLVSSENFLINTCTLLKDGVSSGQALLITPCIAVALFYSDGDFQLRNDNGTLRNPSRS